MKFSAHDFLFFAALVLLFASVLVLGISCASAPPEASTRMIYGN